MLANLSKNIVSYKDHSVV